MPYPWSANQILTASDLNAAFAKSYEIPNYTNVSAFGAVGDGVTDDTMAIQEAITYAQSNQPCIVYFESLSYLITNTLTIGNGSNTAASSYNGVQLVGISTGWLPAQIASAPAVTPSGTRLIWGGPASTSSGVMVEILGPMKAWGVSNIIFDADPSSTFGAYVSVGLNVISGQWGDCDNLVFRGCTTSINSTTVNLTGQLVDSIYNRYRRTRIAVGWTGGAKGIVLTSGTSGNTDFNRFIDTMIALPTALGVSQSAYGVYLHQCDSNHFDGIQFLNGGSGVSYAVVFDYTVNAAFPCGNVISYPDWGGLAGPVQYAGTPGSNSAANTIIAMSEANNGAVPVGVPNLSFVWGTYANIINTNVTGALSAQLVMQTLKSGLYRVGVYALTNSGPSDGKTIQVGIGWTASGIAQGASVVTVSDTPGSFASGSTLALSSSGTQIVYSVTPSATIAGLSMYLQIVVERLA